MKKTSILAKMTFYSKCDFIFGDIKSRDFFRIVLLYFEQKYICDIHTSNFNLWAPLHIPLEKKIGC